MSRLDIGTRARNATAATLLGGAAALALLSAAPASAHHSFAMFDQTRQVKIEGKVAEVQWTNPHVWIMVDVPGEAGAAPVRWNVELTSRVHLERQGFPMDAIKPGDQVTMEVQPYRDGKPGGRFWTVTDARTGKTYRDPSAQRAVEIAAAKTEAAAPPAALANASSPRPGFHLYEHNVANSADAKYADLDALPDWRGIWQPAMGRVTGDDPQLIGEAKAHFEAYTAKRKADPSYEEEEGNSNCDAPGMPYMMTMPYSIEFLFTPGKITVNQEAQMQVRRIYTDGRPLPEHPDPTYFGYSVGHWDGGVLTVETVGLKNGLRLGARGIRTTTDTKVTEKIYLDAQDPDTLHLDFTFEDPNVLAAPWHQNNTFRRNRQWDQIEYVCDENDRHPIGVDGQTTAILEK